MPIVDSLVVTILMTLDDESITSEKWPVADLTNVFFVGSKISIAKASMKKVERKQSNETKIITKFATENEKENNLLEHNHALKFFFFSISRISQSAKVPDAGTEVLTFTVLSTNDTDSTGPSMTRDVATKSINLNMRNLSVDQII